MSGNNTTNITDFDINGFFYARLVCYVIIFIVGVIGNVLVCLVVCRQRKMKNVTNYFIVNLAVADLSVLLICIPFDFGENHYQLLALWGSDVQTRLPAPNNGNDGIGGNASRYKLKQVNLVFLLMLYHDTLSVH